jgi:hypothetical protein
MVGSESQAKTAMFRRHRESLVVGILRSFSTDPHCFLVG